ncbi:MAG: twin-arginine translocase TatA/TatE family subunit [Dehalococcoidia bacterium]|nr:twin-arginine translocase TatA/TatE family subunit [Dehalococcoidia bacterium]
MRLGWLEILIIVFVILLIFGAGRLPVVASSLRKTVHAFKHGFRGEPNEQPPPS